MKHIVAEGDPTRDQNIGLKNKDTGKVLFCYLSSLNAMLATLPKFLEMQQNTSLEGPDEEIYSEEVAFYTRNRKLVASLKRFCGELSVCFHLMHDPLKDGNYKYSPYQIQFSPEDELEELRTFAQKITAKHEEIVQAKEKDRYDSEFYVPKLTQVYRRKFF